MIVGFPGETTPDFERTLDLVRRVGSSSMYSFKYSPRPNTLAPKRMPDDVPEAEKTRRILALQALQRDISWRWHRALGRHRVEVLVDGDLEAARVGAGGPHERQHRRQLSPGRSAIVIGRFGAGANHAKRGRTACRGEVGAC